MKIEVIHYSEELKPHFKSLNLEWLNKYYTPTAAFQGRGIANTLMQAVIEEAKKKGIKKITLETAASLKAAISLYKKTGFVQSSPEEIHPDFGRLTFKMELNLD